MCWNDDYNDDNDKLWLQYKRNRSEEIGEFKSIFMNENPWASINISLKYVRSVPINNKAELVRVLDWCWTGHTPLTASMMTQFDDAYMRHST